MANPWDFYEAEYEALDTGEEPVANNDLPREYVTEGNKWQVPNFDGTARPPFFGRTFVANPVPVNYDLPMKIVIKFEGNGGGWSESLHLGYAASGISDIYETVTQDMQKYLPARLACLSSSNAATQMRISNLKQTRGSKRVIKNKNGLGTGLVSGEPAGLDEGLQSIIYDASHQIKKVEVAGGWAAVDLGITDSSARDRGITSARAQAWQSFLQSFYEPSNNKYLTTGVPFIPSYDQTTSWDDADDIEEWTLDTTLNALQFTTTDNLNLSRGDKVIIHCPRNRYAKRVGGTFYVLDYEVVSTGWKATIQKAPLYPLSSYNLTLSKVMSKGVGYYPTFDHVSGIWTRRENGSPSSQRRGRR
jgi:hypothetical protein